MYLDEKKRGWKNYFSNSNPALCKINRCFLKQADCSTPYEQDKSNKSKMLKLMPGDNQSPWNIVAKVNNTRKDFEETVCYNCTINAYKDNVQQTIATVKNEETG
jgi:hypothetical protein